MTNEFLYDFIKQHKFAVLASVSTEEIPESACVGIVVTPDLRLFFDTVSDSRKYQNLLVNPNISFVIGWENGITVQYEGTARIPDGTDLDDWLQIYFEVFPDGIERKNTWKNIAYFCVQPRWIRYSDFNQTVPLIEEINLLGETDGK